MKYSEFNSEVFSEITNQWFVLPLLTVLLSIPLQAQDADRRISFNRDIRPILSDKCLHCHGPDSATREAELRLDDEQDVLKDRDGYRILVPGKPDESELFSRIVSSDEDEIMPPHDSDRTLSKDETDLIRSWIEQGAKYQQHWSFIPPVRPTTPHYADHNRVINAIDAFVLQRLQSEGLQPSVHADKSTLLRRVSLDLTGLPPTLDELDTFLNDSSDEAYEQVVDRLLKSPRYGEQMARYWLDAARYADTHGYFGDPARSMWRWRDWVINAFNNNMPFDQFTVEQLAGDLIPDATIDQQIASGFNRNNMVMGESGSIDEEYRVENVVDRVHTTATTWLGLTAACARCHDHKFDPISQKEFYSLFAFFNNVPEKGVSSAKGNTKPVLQVPSQDFLEQGKRLKAALAETEEKFQPIEKQLDAAQEVWEKSARTSLPRLSTEHLLVHFPMDKDRANNGSLKKQAAAVGKVPFKPGLLGDSVKFGGDSVLEYAEDLPLDRETPFSFGAWMNVTARRPATIISRNDDVQKLRGFDVLIRKSRLSVHFIHEWNSNAITVETKNSIKKGRWQHMLVTYDGSSSASGVRIYLDGKPQAVVTQHDSLTGSFRTDQPLRIGRRSTSAPYVGLVDDVRLYASELSADQVQELYATQLIQGVASLPVENRTAAQKANLRSLFLTTADGQPFQKAFADRETQRRQVAKHKSSIPDVMVMRDTKEARETFVLVRGQYDQPGEKVTAGVPASLPPIPDGFEADRMGFAKWLVAPSNPLTARVTVNRLWQQLFGIGLVKTANDFGSQGEWPSHPDLLDWLAVEFRDSGWDTKYVMKTIVMSSTYRQSSRVTEELLEHDPKNRLLTRGPRFRMDAEGVRDNALAISGLLHQKIGGPGVMPYQPPGLWEAVSFDSDTSYKQETGDDLYRRSLYTYWKRQIPPPALMAFDAPTRETCTVSRPRTNTPLQALVLLNDITYIEAARVLAQQMMKLTTDDRAKKVEFGFRRATARKPEADESEIFLSTYANQRKRFQTDRKAAEQLVSVGDSQPDTNLDVTELAAWTVVASMILNLDETITKN